MSHAALDPSDTQAIEARIRSRSFEAAASHAAAFLAGGLVVAAVAVAYDVSPVPVALDFGRAVALGLIVLAVLATLIRHAAGAVLRGQRELRRQVMAQSARTDDEVGQYSRELARQWARMNASLAEHEQLLAVVTDANSAASHEEIAELTTEVARQRGQVNIALRDVAELMERIERRLAADIMGVYDLGRCNGQDHGGHMGGSGGTGPS